jgi:hypothetical protein
MKHKHYDLIVAWADGAKIQFKDYDSRWYVINNPMWHDSTEYRIKPEPQQELAQPNIQISQLENQLQACRKLIDEQDEKICELSIKLEYPNRRCENLTVEKPQQEEEPQYFYVYNHTTEGKTYMSPTLMRETSDWDYLGKVEVIK